MVLFSPPAWLLERTDSGTGLFMCYFKDNLCIFVSQTGNGELVDV
jgi:hypothetical protein